MKLVSNFSERLKEALENYPAGKLAAETGLSKQTISAYVTGTRNPKKLTIEAMSKRLNVNILWLMGYDVPKERCGLRIKRKKICSDKSIRLVCNIDSSLYNNLARFAEENGRTLEDELEDRLYWSIENDIESKQADCYTGSYILQSAARGRGKQQVYDEHASELAYDVSQLPETDEDI